MLGDYEKKIPMGTLDFSPVLVKKQNGMAHKITNLKDRGILLQMSWSPISKTADIQASELPVRWIGDL